MRRVTSTFILLLCLFVLLAIPVYADPLPEGDAWVYLPAVRNVASTGGTVEILSSRYENGSGPTGSFDYVYVELYNGGNAPVCNQRVVLNVFAADDLLVDTITDFSILHYISPGKKASVTFLIDGALQSQFDHYSLSLGKNDSCGPAAPSPLTMLTAETILDSGGYTVLHGHVRNDSHRELADMTAVATFYAPDGTILVAVSTYVLPLTLAPGQTGTYWIRTYRDLQGAPYALGAEGSRP